MAESDKTNEDVMRSCARGRVACPTMEAIDALKAEAAGLRDEREGKQATIQRLTAYIDVDKRIIASANAPIPGGVDPFESLPDEMVLMIFLALTLRDRWSGVIESVCRRFHALMSSPLMQRQKRAERWARYASGEIKPVKLDWGYNPLMYMTMGPHHLTVAHHYSIHLIDPKTYKTDATIFMDTDKSIDICAASQNDDTVYCGAARNLRIYKNGELVNKLGFENSHIHEMVTAGGKLYVLDNMSTIHVTTESGEPINHFSSDGMTMAVGGDGTIYAGVRKGIVAYSEMGASLRQMDCNGVVTHIEVDKESGDVYAAVLNEGIRKFSGADESMFSTMSTHSTPLFALSSSYLYVYGKREACITLHCKKTLTELYALPVQNIIRQMCVSAEEKLFALTLGAIDAW
jgi:hypothetical protein